MSTALLVIDMQNDYFPDGAFPLWNTAATLEAVERTIAMATAKDALVIHVQHIADPSAGPAPFFNRGTPGADIHPRIMAAAPTAPIVVKAQADAFIDTDLDGILEQHAVTRLLVCGMMTQNCVTHTAISKTAEQYDVSVLTDCCTTVDEMVHVIALHALGPRGHLVDAATALE